MAEMPFVCGQATFEPPIACPTCGEGVSTADVTVRLSAKPGRTFPSHVELDVRTQSATVAAQPCGHVIYQSSPADPPTGEQP